MCILPVCLAEYCPYEKVDVNQTNSQNKSLVILRNKPQVWNPAGWTDRTGSLLPLWLSGDQNHSRNHSRYGTFPVRLLTRRNESDNIFEHCSN